MHFDPSPQRPACPISADFIYTAVPFYDIFCEYGYSYCTGARDPCYSDCRTYVKIDPRVVVSIASLHFRRPFPFFGASAGLRQPYPGCHLLRYGFTQSEKRPLHHGIDLKNSLGTPVLAAGVGTVIVAGNDKEVVYGEKENFYGNLIVIQHDFC